jgi:hypothetical protein
MMPPSPSDGDTSQRSWRGECIDEPTTIDDGRAVNDAGHQTSTYTLIPRFRQPEASVSLSSFVLLALQ